MLLNKQISTINSKDKEQQLDHTIPSKVNTIIPPLVNKLKMDVKFGASCDYHRLILPMSCGELHSKNEVMVFNRNSTIGMKGVMQLKSQGVKIVVDVDDYWILNPNHYLYARLAEYMEREIAAYLKLADVVTVTTEVLADKVMTLNKNVVVVPNALPFDQGQFTLSQDKSSISDLVYVAGASHREDSLEMGFKTFRDNLTFAGYEPKHVEWKKIQAYFPEARYKGLKKLDSYMSLYDGHKIAIAPLQKNDFNACKSNLKALEAGAKGLPLIASPTHPYLNNVDKNHVLYAESVWEWEKQVKLLTTDKLYYEDVAQALASHVRTTYPIEKSNAIRQQIFDSL